MSVLTRRAFLASVSAGTATAAVPSYFMQTADKSGRRLPVTGSGPHTYECIHDWLVPPEGLVWGDTHGLAQDAQGHIYVAHTVNKSSMRGESVVVYDASGKFVRAFGEEFRGGAHGLGLRHEGSGEVLYHCDINRCKIVRTTLGGDAVWSHGYPREDPAYSERPIDFVPTNVAFAPNGDFYVGDGYGSHRVLRFSGDGRFLGEVGKPGKGEGEFDTPHGLFVDTRGSRPVLVVADRGNRRVQSFSLDGAHLRTIQDDPHLRMPCHFDTRGEWMVCPDLDSQVCILDREYKVVAQLGDGRALNGEVGSRRKQSRGEFTPGQFITPHAAIFLHSGDILVAEWLPIGRLTLLRRV
jgi:sugar lactone lactonase YvrE